MRDIPWPPSNERVETPISTVWLTPDLAYKTKKPVRLPFLDFTALERRHHFLLEELRLNQRTAPGLYLDVMPVVGDPPRLGEEGVPLDWVLRMRRFASGALLAEMAEQDRLQPEHADALAAHVAAFHQSLAPLKGDQLPVKDVAVWAAESFDEVAAHALRPPDVNHERVEALRQSLMDGLAAQALWRSERAAQGWVREGHGDLHLGNLVEWQGQVVAFDCLEFDRELRCVDVINDIAFAFMDLLVAGRPDLAWRFVSAYVERTGDYAGLKGLRSFAAYRALVRAKVALLGGHVERFRRYWSGAEGLAAPPPPPRLWMVMGLSGSGKSTVAQALLQAWSAHPQAHGAGAVRVRSDVERKRLLGVAATARPQPGDDWYSPERNRATYARLQDMSAQLLRTGVSVVVDAALLRQPEREAFRDLAIRLGVPWRLWECVAPAELMEQRLRERERSQHDASDAGVEVMQRQRQWMEPVPPEWAPWHDTVVNDGGLETLKARVMALLPC